MSNGWIKLHRQIRDNEFWRKEPFTRGQAWVDLILIANHEDSWILVRGIKVPIKRGQVGWSELRLATEWRWSRSKVRLFLKLLENEQQIEQHRNNVSLTITIKNYQKYQINEQQNEQQKDNRKTTEGQQKDTNKNDKNVKNDKNSIGEKSNEKETIHVTSSVGFQKYDPRVDQIITGVLTALDLKDFVEDGKKKAKLLREFHSLIRGKTDEEINSAWNRIRSYQYFDKFRYLETFTNHFRSIL